MPHIKREWKLNEKNLFSLFNNIRYRCNNAWYAQYHNYWWRWIKCEWNSFEEFYNDMLPWYSPWLSIDRINNDWNYCKENCQWITKSQNSRKANKEYIPEWPMVIPKKRKFNPLDALFDNSWLNIKWYCWEEKEFYQRKKVIDWIEIISYGAVWCY